jgi:alpha-tubulin suppressor-like RCC1 family protein
MKRFSPPVLALAVVLATLGPARPQPSWAAVTRAISGGGQHTCALPGDGTAKCWGLNDFGQLGDGTTTEHHTPVAVSGLTDAVSISAGTSHSCALLNDGTAKCWGWNGFGQLGDGTNVERHTPVAVSGLGNLIAVDASGNRTCALIDDGTVRCWGENSSGQLGDGTTTSRANPVTVSGLSNAVGIGGGEYHTCALLSDGTVECWGSNGAGQLGDGTTTDRLTPVVVAGLNNAMAIAAGRSYAHTCALLSDGTARCWGYNFDGQLGDGTNTSSSTPVTVSGLTNAIAVLPGWEHTCALLSDGTVECWGSGYGSNPVAISGLSDAVATAAGWYHRCALLGNGGAKCWGFNGYGQLGDGTTTNSTTPVVVLNFPNCVPPSNNYFASAATVGAVPFAASLPTTCAGWETSEPQHCASIGSTVWYSYTPSENGLLQADTEGSGYDTALAIYVGSDLAGLSSISCDDDSGPGLTSLITFNAVAGTTYRFQAGGFAGSKGDLAFRLLAPSATPTPTVTPTPTATSTPCPPGACTPTPTPTSTPTSERSAPKASIDETVNGQQGPITVHVGDLVIFRWVVTNDGDRPFYADVVNDVFPTLDGHCSWVSPGSTCEKTTDVMLTTVGPLANFSQVAACGIPPGPYCDIEEDYVKVNAVLSESTATPDAPVGGVAEAPDAAESGGGSSSPWAAGVATAVVSVLALAMGGWLVRRRLRG